MPAILNSELFAGAFLTRNNPAASPPHAEARGKAGKSTTTTKTSTLYDWSTEEANAEMDFDQPLFVGLLHTLFNIALPVTIKPEHPISLEYAQTVFESLLTARFLIYFKNIHALPRTLFCNPFKLNFDPRPGFPLPKCSQISILFAILGVGHVAFFFCRLSF